MAEYAILDGGVIVEYRDLDEVPVLKGKSYRKFLPVEDTNPLFDTATEVKNGPVVTILADKVTRVWTVRAKTPAELGIDKVTIVDTNFAPPVIDVLHDIESRVRAVEGKPPIDKDAYQKFLETLVKPEDDLRISPLTEAIS